MVAALLFSILVMAANAAAASKSSQIKVMPHDVGSELYEELESPARTLQAGSEWRFISPPDGSHFPAGTTVCIDIDTTGIPAWATMRVSLFQGTSDNLILEEETLADAYVIRWCSNGPMHTAAQYVLVAQFYDDFDFTYYDDAAMSFFIDAPPAPATDPAPADDGFVPLKWKPEVKSLLNEYAGPVHGIGCYKRSTAAWGSVNWTWTGRTVVKFHPNVCRLFREWYGSAQGGFDTPGLFATSVLTLAHESRHVVGVMNECKAEKQALKRYKAWAQRLGAPFAFLKQTKQIAVRKSQKWQRNNGCL